MKPEVWEAIQRLRKVKTDGLFATYPDAIDPGESYCDDERVAADYLCTIAPDAPEPEPIVSYDATVGGTLWNYDDEGEIYSGVVIATDTGLQGIRWKDSVGFGDQGYRTEADARLALQWQRVKELEQGT